MTWPTPAPDNDPATPGDIKIRQDQVQGNIVAGFSKDHQVFLLVSFPAAASGRAWLNALQDRIATTEHVATFNVQFSEARRARGGDDPENLKAVWVNAALTYPGLLALSPGLAGDLEQFEAFRSGPAARAEFLGDRGLSDPTQWLFGGVDQLPVHAMLTIAADVRDDLRLEMDRQRLLLSENRVATVFEQRGDTLPGHRAGHEHFGFKDGVSQPGVIGFHEPEPGTDERKNHAGTKMVPAGEFVLGYPGVGGAIRPHAPWMADGSFHVLRRLRQNVPGWWAQVTARVSSLAGDPIKEDLLGAKLVGRWRSGTPLALAPERDHRSSKDRSRDNAFTYGEDPHGHATPQFAHIRKVYPRDDAAFGDSRRRILRRGIPFGLPFDPAAGRGHGADTARGLVFNAFMASIEDQFEFLQQSWANNAEFPPGSAAGPDPVIGETGAPVRLQRPDRPDLSLGFERFVFTEGAVYAFAPSLAALRRLGNGEL